MCVCMTCTFGLGVLLVTCDDALMGDPVVLLWALPSVIGPTEASGWPVALITAPTAVVARLACSCWPRATLLLMILPDKTGACIAKPVPVKWNNLQDWMAVYTVSHLQVRSAATLILKPYSSHMPVMHLWCHLTWPPPRELWCCI